MAKRVLASGPTRKKGSCMVKGVHMGGFNICIPLRVLRRVRWRHICCAALRFGGSCALIEFNNAQLRWCQQLRCVAFTLTLTYDAQTMFGCTPRRAHVCGLTSWSALLPTSKCTQPGLLCPWHSRSMAASCKHHFKSIVQANAERPHPPSSPPYRKNGLGSVQDMADAALMVGTSVEICWKGLLLPFRAAMHVFVLIHRAAACTCLC